MNYVLIENGNLTDGPRALPMNWRNISGLKFLPEDEIFSLGWKRHRFVPYEGDMTTKVVIDSITEITDTEYIEHQQVREKTQEEKNSEDESLWFNVRSVRNQLLTESDWTQLYDSPLSVEKKTEWATYRQDLRSIPQDFPNPHSVVWPTPPSN